MAAVDRNDQRHAADQRRGTDQQQAVRSDCVDDSRDNRRARSAAQTGAGTDEAEQPLGLPGVVDLVGQRPELADEEEAEDLTEQVKRHGDPLGSCSQDRKSTRLNSSHSQISYAVFCLKKKTT